MQPAIDLPARVRAAAETSELVRAVRSVAADGGVRFALGETPLRPLSRQEVELLERLGNWAQDWSRVRVAERFDPQSVRHSNFHGDVILGRFARSIHVAEGLELPAGIYHSTVANCVIADDVLIRHVRLLVNYEVGEAAVLVDCGSITCDRATPFGNGTDLPIAIETGGRDVRVYAEIDVEVAAAVARSRSDRDRLELYAKAVADYTAQATSNRGIIERGTVVRSTTSVRNTYLGPHAEVDGATLLADSTILSNEQESAHIQSGACVTRSLIQWGSHVATMAIVDSSVLTEH